MKKILIINTAGLGVGGITTHMENYLSKIDYSKAEINIVSTICEDKHAIDIFERYGCNIIRLPNRMKNPIAYFMALANTLKRSHYNVAHVHGSSCTILLELYLLKKYDVEVRIAHSHNTTCSFKLIHYCCKPFMHYYYNKAFACSMQAGKWMFGKRLFEILHNVFDYHKYAYSEETRINKRKELNIKDDELAFCVIGNLTKQKNQQFALSLFSLLDIKKKSQLFIMGSGPMLSDLKAIAKEIHRCEDVIFMGARNDVQELLQAFDIYLMPSKWEGLPMALMEAQASGILCFVSDKITQEAKICNDIQFLSLNSMKIWAKEIKLSLKKAQPIYRKERSLEAEALLKENYEINIEFPKLRQSYKL